MHLDVGDLGIVLDAHLNGVAGRTPLRALLDRGRISRGIELVGDVLRGSPATDLGSAVMASTNDRADPTSGLAPAGAGASSAVDSEPPRPSPSPDRPDRAAVATDS
jgi:hypothetical protein